jgi:hypothetical protein
VADAAALAPVAIGVLGNSARATAMAQAARAAVAEEAGLPGRIATVLLDLLPPGPGTLPGRNQAGASPAETSVSA